MRRHPLDLVAAVFGVLFVIGAAAWLSWDRDWLDLDELAWIAPSALIVAGAVGLLGSLRRPRG